MKPVGLILSLFVIAGAAFLLHNTDETQRPDALGLAAMSQDPPNYPKAVELYRQALSADQANPYRWSDLAEAFAGAGQVDFARYCYHQALALGGNVPQIWLRAANFHFNRDEYNEALPLAAKVLRTVPDYDSVLFEYFDQLLPTADLVFVSIGTNRRIVRAYTQHLIDNGNLRAARIAYRFANAAGFLDNSLTASYVDGMIKARRAPQAQLDWLSYINARKGDYPDRNLIYNYSFENTPSGVPFDWKVVPSEAFDTVVDKSIAYGGHASLRITFHGDANVSYNNLEQLTLVPKGRYILQAWVRTQGITTNEGPRLIIAEAEGEQKTVIRTDCLTGSSGWTLLSEPLTVRQPQLLRIGIVRDPSRKFDNKIAGSLWLDDVKLFRDIKSTNGLN